jgi:hypothetical protein
MLRQVRLMFFQPLGTIAAVTVIFSISSRDENSISGQISPSHSFFLPDISISPNHLDNTGHVAFWSTSSQKSLEQHWKCRSLQGNSDQYRSFEGREFREESEKEVVWHDPDR